MQAEEVFSVEREDRPAFRRGVRQNGLIVPALSVGLLHRPHVVAHPAQFDDYAEVEILIRIEQRHRDSSRAKGSENGCEVFATQCRVEGFSDVIITEPELAPAEDQTTNLVGASVFDHARFVLPQ